MSTTDAGRPTGVEEEITVGPDGRRIVRITYTRAGGRTWSVEHDYPDAVRHFYMPGELNEAIQLYRGRFSLVDDDRGQVFDGGAWFSWTPTTRVHAAGERADGDEQDRYGLPNAPQTMWVDIPAIDVPLVEGQLPPQPQEPIKPWTRSTGSYYAEWRLRWSPIGNGAHIDRVTFLIPNGWESHDGTAVCDPADRAATWHGRLQATRNGWIVTIDPLGGLSGHRKSLKECGGARVTHVAELRRQDGQPFEAESALNVLDTIRVALNLALGRATGCLLPVGWKNDTPCWAMWANANVDPYRSVDTWLDPTITAAQLAELLERALAVCADGDRHQVIKYATSYYITATYDVDVELATAVPISGLQLLAYNRFVEEQGTYSKSQWNDPKRHPKNTEAEIRILLEDCHVDTSIPAHFEHLADVSRKLQDEASGEPPDALTCVIRMRNSIIHPTRNKPHRWSMYEWVEAGVMVRYFLRMAILNTLGYRGKHHSTIVANRWVGQVSDVPWAM